LPERMGDVLSALRTRQLAALGGRVIVKASESNVLIPDATGPTARGGHILARFPDKPKAIELRTDVLELVEAVGQKRTTTRADSEAHRQRGIAYRVRSCKRARTQVLKRDVTALVVERARASFASDHALPNAARAVSICDVSVASIAWRVDPVVLVLRLQEDESKQAHESAAALVDDFLIANPIPDPGNNAEFGQVVERLEWAEGY